MTTLESIHANGLVIVMISVLVVTVLYLLYCAVDNKDINFKVLGVFICVVSAIMVPFQNHYYSGEENRVLKRFTSGNDIVCKFNENSNIVVSQKRGYKLKNRFFMKDEMAIKLGSCYLIEQD